MATGPLPSSRRSRLADIIRTPFRSNSVPEVNDWYIPYNGPIEAPRHSVAVGPGVTSLELPQHLVFDQQRRPSTSADMPMRLESRAQQQSSSTGAFASSKRGRKPVPKVISLDTGGIGESPASILDDTHHHHSTARRPSAAHIFSHHKEKQPPSSQPTAVPYVGQRLNHPYNPTGSGFETFAFPTTSNDLSSTTTTTTTNKNHLSPSTGPFLALSLPSPTFPAPVANSSNDRHPYSANTLRTGTDSSWPNYGTVSSRSRAPTFVSTQLTGASASTALSSVPSEWDNSDRTRGLVDSSGRYRATPEAVSPTSVTFATNSGSPSTSRQQPPLTKSRSTPQHLNTATLVAPLSSPPKPITYSLQSHPYATSPIIPSASHATLKPPIPAKSPGLLHRLKSSVSAPNLAAQSRQHGRIAERKESISSNLSRRAAAPGRIDIPNPSQDANAFTTKIPTHTSMVHTNPITLQPASSVSSFAHPRPRFVPTLVPSYEPIPSSPYPLSRPPYKEFDNSDQNILAQCLPVSHVGGHRRSKKTVEVDPLASFSSPGGGNAEETAVNNRDGIEGDSAELEKKAWEKNDVIARAVRDNELLRVERQRWEQTAVRSLGNKRSRSLSNKGPLTGPRRSVSHSALATMAAAQSNEFGVRPSDGLNAYGLPNRSATTRGRSGTTSGHTGGFQNWSMGTVKRSRSATLDQTMAAGGGHRGRKSSSNNGGGELHSWHSKSSGNGNSLRYLASAAFGHSHSHSRKISIESSSARSRSSAGGPQVVKGHLVAGSSGSHSRDSSADITRIGTIPSSARRDRDEDMDVVDIRSATEDEARAAVEQRIGLALSPSPEPRKDVITTPMLGHPYASPSLMSMSSPNTPTSRAGPHPANVHIASNVPFKDDVATRHRLPPQVVNAHKRSLSQTPRINGSTSPSAVTGATSSTSLSASTSSPNIESHPFNVNTADKKQRPTSGRVEQAFEEALLASTASSEWPEFHSLTAELRDGDPDPFRRNVPSIAPSTPPRKSTSRQTTPRKSSMKSFDYGSYTPLKAPPIPKMIRRRSRSMSDILSIDQSTSSAPLPRSVAGNTLGQSWSHFGPYDAPNFETRPIPDETFNPSLSSHWDNGNSSTSPPTSIASAVNPEIVVRDEGEEDLEEFRDLFYRPYPAFDMSADNSPRESMRSASEGRPASGSSTLWNVLSPVFGGEFDATRSNHPLSVHQTESEVRGYSDVASSRYRAASDDGKP